MKLSRFLPVFSCTFLEHVMADYGFTVYDDEWWHFDFYSWSHYPIMNTGFEDL